MMWGVGTGSAGPRWRGRDEQECESNCGEQFLHVANRMIAPGAIPIQEWLRGVSRCYPAGLETTCPFCNVAAERIWMENEHAIAVPDAFPVTDGHMLIVPRKHVSSTYELEMHEQQAIWALAGEVHQRLLTGLTPPDGFNIGFNDGLAAGQTVEHAHVHIIPRRHGDVPDPRGGMRWVVADNAPYWKK